MSTNIQTHESIGLTLTTRSQGPVRVGVDGGVTTASGYAIYGGPATPWRIFNLGTISAGGSAGTGVVLAGGGIVVNGNSHLGDGLIAGAEMGSRSPANLAP